MPENKGEHLTIEDRQVIEDGIRDGLGCREIARRLHVAPSTVSREVEANRTATLTKRKDFKPGRNCTRFNECEEVGTACASCSTYKTRCRSCRTRRCIDLCAKFELRECPEFQQTATAHLLGVLADGADGSHVLLQQRFPSVQVAAVNLVALLPQLLQPAEGGLHHLGGHPAASSARRRRPPPFRGTSRSSAIPFSVTADVPRSNRGSGSCSHTWA